MNTRTLIFAALAVTGLTACQDVVGTTGDLSRDEAIQIADGMAAASFDATGAVASADASTTDGSLLIYADPITSSTRFTITRTCPLGGQVVLEGTRVREWDRQAHTGFSDLSLTKTHEDCTRPFRDTDVTVTLNGAPNVAVQAHHQWAAGQRSGLQTLSMEGAIDWTTSDGRSGTCAIDLDISFDPDTHTRTVVGTVCRTTIDMTTTWHQGG